MNMLQKIILTYGFLFILIILCLIRKRKIRIFSSIILVFTITFFALLSPQGKIIAQIWNLKITLGAMEAGLLKSGRLCLCLYASKLIVSNKIKIPGKAGLFFNETMNILNSLTESKPDFSKGLIKAIDDILIKTKIDKK